MSYSTSHDKQLDNTVRELRRWYVVFGGTLYVEAADAIDELRKEISTLRSELSRRDPSAAVES
jgi:hypothetical protein